MEQQATILIVDDAPDNISILNAILREHYKIKAASNGMRALTLANQQPKPALILLDIMMPEMDGYAVCQQLKANPATVDIPVIFVTAKSDEANEAQGFELGAVDYITKPVKPPVVLARVRTHLQQRQMQLELEQKNDALKQAAQLRDDVERITRHDLKTPLNNIIVTPQLLLNKYVFADEDAHLLKEIERSGHKMLDMINRSLDLYKMETGTYPLTAQPMDILPLLYNVLDELKGSTVAANKKSLILLHGQPLTQGTEFWVTVEEMLCYPMLSNLLLNAFEAAPEQSQIEVELDYAGDDAVIKITNEGIVPVEIQDNFFDKYTTHGKKGGTGLGTYSARLCAETQNGSIAMQQLNNAQTQVIVKLPRKQEDFSLDELNALITAINHG